MTNSQTALLRSPNSHAFEAFWRALPMESTAPHRREFRPERATRFLRSLLLLEAPRAGDAQLKIRLVGSAIQLRIQRDITGADYLDFLPPEYRADALDSGRLVLGTPCGMWQCMDVHYERGFSQRLEVTMFPLVADVDGMPLLLCLIEPMNELVTPMPATGLALKVDTAAAYAFIDVGAGRPAWPQAA